MLFDGFYIISSHVYHFFAHHFFLHLRLSYWDHIPSSYIIYFQISLVRNFTLLSLSCHSENILLLCLIFFNSLQCVYFCISFIYTASWVWEFNISGKFLFSSNIASSLRLYYLSYYIKKMDYHPLPIISQPQFFSSFKKKFQVL